jgi:hypothetical protein
LTLSKITAGLNFGSSKMIDLKKIEVAVDSAMLNYGFAVAIAGL